MDVDTPCRCGHSYDAHLHYRAGEDCSRCWCRAFRRVRVGVRLRMWWRAWRQLVWVAIDTAGTGVDPAQF